MRFSDKEQSLLSSLLKRSPGPLFIPPPPPQDEARFRREEHTLCEHCFLRTAKGDRIVPTLPLQIQRQLLNKHPGAAKLFCFAVQQHSKDWRTTWSPRAPWVKAYSDVTTGQQSGFYFYFQIHMCISDKPFGFDFVSICRCSWNTLFKRTTATEQRNRGVNPIGSAVHWPCSNHPKAAAQQPQVNAWHQSCTPTATEVSDRAQKHSKVTARLTLQCPWRRNKQIGFLVREGFSANSSLSSFLQMKVKWVGTAYQAAAMENTFLEQNSMLKSLKANVSTWKSKNDLIITIIIRDNHRLRPCMLRRNRASRTILCGNY